jgi:hypothetical protein
MCTTGLMHRCVQHMQVDLHDISKSIVLYGVCVCEGLRTQDRPRRYLRSRRCVRGLFVVLGDGQELRAGGTHAHERIGNS